MKSIFSVNLQPPAVRHPLPDTLPLSAFPNVIHRNYMALVRETDAKEFWAITPANVKHQVAKFPAQAAA
jgi:hypothetical protein